VRFYRTVSPLPIRKSAVCFLWHFPSGHPGRELPGTVPRWSPDFPPLPGYPSSGGRPTLWQCCLSGFVSILPRAGVTNIHSRSISGDSRIIQPLKNSQELSIVEYDDSLADYFYTINAQWIETMFVLEATDVDVLSHPRETIIDKGGVILFVRSIQHGIVGACALKKTSEGYFELTKMGVLENIRGLKAGEFLLAAILTRARSMKITTLYLLTNKKCEAAIHLYEKYGFEHSAEIMRDYGQKYERTDVAMKFRF
jgi:N-acetylglutamate synthase-like GNAT family acetyltransferase